MKPKEISDLARLAGLVAERTRGELAFHDARYAPLRQKLEELSAPPPDLGRATVPEWRDRANWEAWRAGERQMLTIELARAETVLRPLRAKVARAVARERVLERLSDRGKPRLRR